jgi:hypothetical protein
LINENSSIVSPLLSWYQLNPRSFFSAAYPPVSMAHSPGTSSSSSSGASAAGGDLNPFHVAAPALPVSASSIPLLNIRHHVPETLDLHGANYASWSSLFELTFRKLGLLDHADGTVDAQARLHDAEWTQIDHCIVAWIYLTVSKTIRDMVFHRCATAFSAWNAVRGLFLNNASQRVVYALQDFHSLQQGDLSVHDYCCRLKRLADTLTDVVHPITDQDLVVNTMRGLSNKFTNALDVINAMNPLPSFLWVHSYLGLGKIPDTHYPYPNYPNPNPNYPNPRYPKLVWVIRVIHSGTQTTRTTRNLPLSLYLFTCC